MKLRVAMVGACPYPAPQGSQILLRDTALALQSRGHEVHLLVYGYGAELPAPPRFSLEGVRGNLSFSQKKGSPGSSGSSGSPGSPEIPIHRCARIPGVRKTAAGPSCAKPFLDLAMVAALRRVIREQGIDVVHAHNYEGLVIALAARKHPIVYHAHNAMADELPYYFGASQTRSAGSLFRFTRRFGAWLDKRFPRRADHVIAPHQRLADYLIQCGCDNARISVIPPAVDAALFDANPILDEPPPVLYAGNLDAYQNLDLLLQTMTRVRHTEPDARLIIATHTKASVPHAEVVPTPDFDSLRRVLAMDAVFVCPRVSWSGYPIKLLNAMAAGKAVVVCRSAAHPITHNQTGLIVPDNDETAFAEAILRLMKNPILREQLGRNARDTAKTHHNPTRIACQIEALYEQLV